MSEPVTNVEIEDVLSSIRKLVAEETRSTPPARKPAEADRLVLTPAQRVPDAPARPEPVVLSERIADDSPVAKIVEDKPIDDIPGDARLAEYGEVEAAFPDIDAFEAESAPDAAGERLNLGRMIEQEVAAALGGAQPSDEVDDSADGRLADSDDDIDWKALDAADDAENMAAAGAAEQTEQVAGDAGLTPEAESVAEAPPQTLEAKVAALGRLVARDTGEFEEERDTPIELSDPVAHDPAAWASEDPDAASAETVDVDDVTLSGAHDPHHDLSLYASKDEDLSPADNGLHADDAVAPEPVSDGAMTAALQIDEDDLREMVGDIVRQELQGALGERITRNVRKLVRREIHRMLISQELE